MSTPVVRGEIDLFQLPSTDTTVQSSFYTEYKPVVNIMDSDAKIEFRLSGNSDQYIDLNDSFLHLLVKVVDGEGNKLKSDAEISTTNNFLHSIFSQVELFVNNQLISSSNTCYPYKAYLETIFSFGNEYLSNQGQCFMFHKDTAGGKLGDDNLGYKARKARITSSKPVELIGKLRFDLGGQERYILNDTNVTISLTKNTEKFSLLYTPPSEADSLNPKIRFLDASFYVRKQVLYPSIAISHQKELINGRSALYPYTSSDLKQFTISAGNLSFIEENVFLGSIPSRIVVCLTSNAGFIGSYSSNPFKFEHFGLNYISVTVNNMPIPIRGMNLDFAGDIYRLPYYIMLNSIGLANSNDGVVINPSDYANGNVFFIYDLHQISTSNASMLLESTGSLRIELKFSSALKEAVTCLIYSEKQAILEVDKFRRVTST